MKKEQIIKAWECSSPDEEVLDGEWGFDGLGWSCSSCGEYPVPGQADPHKPMLDTCPNCGAVMANADKTAKEVLFPLQTGNE